MRNTPAFDLLVIDDGRVAAGVWGVPLAWDGTVADLPEGYDGSLLRSIEAHESGERVDTLSIMAAAVTAGASRKGLAGAALTSLKDKAAGAGLEKVICPVRPTLKSSYPLTPIARFASWRRDDGTALDP